MLIKTCSVKPFYRTGNMDAQEYKTTDFQK